MKLRLAKKVIRPGVEKRRGTTIDRAYDRVSKLRPNWEMRYADWGVVMRRQMRRNNHRQFGFSMAERPVGRYRSYRYGVTIPLEPRV